MTEMNPKSDWFRRYSYEKDETREMIEEFVRVYRLSPETHPRVLDLHAGDGSFAGILKRLGWPENQMVCLDKYKSPDPLVQGVRWIYVDTSPFTYELMNNNTISYNALSVFKESFDIVGAFQTDLNPDYEEKLCRFFARSGGFIFSSFFTGKV